MTMSNPSLRALGVPRKSRQKDYKHKKGWRTLRIHSPVNQHNGFKETETTYTGLSHVFSWVCEFHTLDCYLGLQVQSCILSYGAGLNFNQKQVYCLSSIYVTVVPMSTSCYAGHFCSSHDLQVCKTFDDLFILVSYCYERQPSGRKVPAQYYLDLLKSCN